MVESSLTSESKSFGKGTVSCTKVLSPREWSTLHRVICSFYLHRCPFKNGSRLWVWEMIHSSDHFVVSNWNAKGLPVVLSFVSHFTLHYPHVLQFMWRKSAIVRREGLRFFQREIASASEFLFLEGFGYDQKTTSDQEVKMKIRHDTEFCSSRSPFLCWDWDVWGGLRWSCFNLHDMSWNMSFNVGYLVLHAQWGHCTRSECSAHELAHVCDAAWFTL